MESNPTAIGTLIADNLALFHRPGVLSVRAGYRFIDDWIVDIPAIVVTVSPGSADHGLPEAVAGIPVDVRTASAAKERRLADPTAPGSVGRRTPDGYAVAEFASEWSFASGSAVAAQSAETALSSADDAAPALAAKPQLPYVPATNTPLEPVSGTFTIQLSASPDSAWPTLKPFLAGTTTSLSLAMYDFTSAHILAEVENALTGKSFQLVLDHPSKNPTADQTDEQTVASLRSTLGSPFSQAWALERSDPFATAWIFPSAYHIKVAVRDSSAMWLSSGNLNNSNQPDIDPVNVPADAAAARSGDRDWHVIVDDSALSQTFEAYIHNDFVTASANNAMPAAAVDEQEADLPRLQTPPFAQFFASKTISAPMTLVPLLTPDPGVYVDAVVALIASATTSLYLQFQYIELPPSPTATSAALVRLVTAVIERQKAGIDVKVIMSEFETAGFLEQLQTAGLDVVTNVRLQNNVHNKGIVVDAESVLVSSQNWSSAGVFANRDAGMIIHNAEAAQYFQSLFLHDWDTLTVKKAIQD